MRALCILFPVTILSFAAIGCDQSAINDLIDAVTNAVNSDNGEPNNGEPNNGEPNDDHGGAIEPNDDHGGDRNDDSRVAAGMGNDDGTNGVGGATGGAAQADVRISAALRGDGGASGRAEYRVESDRRRFKVQCENCPPGTYDVTLNGQPVGTIVVGALRRGEVEFDSKAEAGHVVLPASFPASVVSGDVVAVGSIVVGAF